MPDTAPDAHVHLALHPQHPSAVVATLTGTTLHTARATLASEGFRPVCDDTMLLVRIDHEEPYYANITANLLCDVGIPVDITDPLQEEIDTEWTWANHPTTWLDRHEIRLVSAEAQKCRRTNERAPPRTNESAPKLMWWRVGAASLLLS
ncbi:hypothetical protein ACFYO9_38490, partial [Streptomyces sp. NPDC005863]